ncbi:MAG TPA: hypothetical protein VN249_12570 [Prolixibacteraceae bacterium]|nr:hypothetical protein [Prolixibacteraceae bacterium]
MGSGAGLVDRKIEKLTIPEANSPVEWKQENNALVIRCPENLDSKYVLCFKEIPIDEFLIYIEIPGIARFYDSIP